MLKQSSVFRFVFVLALMLSVAATATASVMSAPSVALSAAQEAATVGADNCDKAEGVAWSLGVAAVFGCGWCAVGALVIGTGTFLLC